MTDETDDTGIAHREVMHLAVPAARVHEFVMTPERILDYYPEPIEGGVFEAGRSFWCRGAMGVSMLERTDASTADCTVVLVTTAVGLEPPYTPDAIRAAGTITMVEEWAVAADGDGSVLTKTWRDVMAGGEPSPPLAEIVRDAAKHESSALIAGWNAAAG
ncbi:MAG: hypothetical protein U0W40_20870 [Acidimicrobiia bacterium]